MVRCPTCIESSVPGWMMSDDGQPCPTCTPKDGSSIGGTGYFGPPIVSSEQPPPPPKLTAADLLQECADLYRTRNAVYKDNYKHIGPVLAGFFPNGITLKTPEDFIRFHLFMLIHVKLTRYTNNWAAGHADSLHDTSVYAAMLQQVDEDFRQQALEASVDHPR